jgi:NADPH:quinone reductase-like Zn-dependent oxidoreductase
MNTVIAYSRYGGPEVLSVSAKEIPQPGPGQVRIRVKAVAVNPIDAKIRSGRLDGFFPVQFPVVPGWDVAGVVDRVITIADESAPEHGVRFTGQDPADRAPEALPELAQLLANGGLAVPVWRTYPLAEAAKAHTDLDAHRNQGKIVLFP